MAQMMLNFALRLSSRQKFDDGEHDVELEKKEATRQARGMEEEGKRRDLAKVRKSDMEASGLSTALAPKKTIKRRNVGPKDYDVCGDRVAAEKQGLNEC
jgi:hypothetical protein